MWRLGISASPQIKAYAYAQLRLGACYYKGEGVSKNYAEAVKWLRLAAKQENRPAQDLLKEMKETW